MKTFRLCIVALILSAFVISPAVSQQQEPVYWEVVGKIREEGFKRSQVMDLVGYMCDILGPRLTGSPREKRAQQWARDKFKEIGLENAVIEEAGKHGVNWDNEYSSLHMLKPDYQALLGYPKAFTPGTNGKITAEAALVEINSEADLEKYRGKLRGKIVLYAPEFKIGHRFTPNSARFSDTELRELEKYSPAQAPARPTVTIPRDEYEKLQKGDRPPKPVERKKLEEFFKSEGVQVLVDIGRGRGDYGTVMAQARDGSREDRSYETVLKSLPEVSLASEHYNRICRILKRGIPVTLEMEVRNSVGNSDPRYYNVLGDLPGTDLKDELVIIGGHFDSWHTGTGAADDASGCAVALEAARILKAIGVKPRRTVRVAFWTYEEGGLNGSGGYVKRHLGDPQEGKKPEYEKLSGYFNMDNGGGRFRGVNLQGNEQVRPIFQAWMMPFRDLGMTTLSGRSVGSTDHFPFDRVGLNGWQFIQDRLDYQPIRHHSNMDVYDGLDPEDMMINAVIMASFAYHTAMRDKLLPRKLWVPPAANP